MEKTRRDVLIVSDLPQEHLIYFLFGVTLDLHFDFQTPLDLEHIIYDVSSLSGKLNHNSAIQLRKENVLKVYIKECYCKNNCYNFKRIDC